MNNKDVIINELNIKDHYSTSKLYCIFSRDEKGFTHIGIGLRMYYDHYLVSLNFRFDEYLDIVYEILSVQDQLDAWSIQI